MSVLKEQIAEFCLSGQLIGFVVKDGYKVKYLRLHASEMEYWIKIDKEVRSQLSPAMVPGCWLEARGISTLCRKTGKLTLKAESISFQPGEAALMQPVAPPAMKEAPLPALPNFEAARGEKPKKAATAEILVCEKSSCWKRGGKQICEAIAQTLQEKGLEDKVEIKRTGCLKQCKEGPNLVILPDKAKYSQVRPYQVASLLEKHRLS